ncbi:LamG-like jellyroll fold domain-containing protein [Streptomyces sp. P9(2023)]|uniref:LamG-like jellyroll fold domain-containing protein n=1 Tax=Streptomyces sp. P9(2023) TaxID=3064394 RepID=UPI0028F42C1D|nr:LamG-like jellyroll fold domain-containing protein [Streptomyces sp. P9(2023)]MDT9687290.1 LamG-like jellyroll fold domain-containing protein [Streptomyces sp. P9(2023)]
MSSSIGTGRRTVLRAAGVAAAASATVGIAGTSSSAATPGDNVAGSRHRPEPDMDNPRFTLAVMPDTQYLFDGTSIHKEPVEAALRYVLDHAGDENIVFLSHLGDLTENGRAEEFAPLSEAFRLLDRRGAGYSVLAGNHDIDSRTDDQRGRSPYLDAFGPQRMRGLRTFGGASPDGYNTYHLFRAAGREWLVLALDWRPSAAGLAWARKVIAEHPSTPVILTTHDLVHADGGNGEAELSGHGQHLWNELIEDNDHIFLTLNGHFWPAGRTVRKNAAGNDVHLHITNYQDRYFGGSAMIRLYRFDLSRNTIDVSTFSPWLLAKEEKGRLNALERRELELTDEADDFSVPVDFEKRFAGFAPVTPRRPRPAASMLVPGTLAYWRFDTGRPDGAPAAETLRVPDLSGHGNDLIRTAVPGSPAEALRWSAEHHPDQPGHGSLYFDGGRPPLRGAYLSTAKGAPLDTATFRAGFTVEAFFKLPADWTGARNAWSAIISRQGTLAAAGKQGDPVEPVATLSVSDGHALQWAVAPLNQDRIITSWSHELPLDTWWHAAVVNDGHRTTLYVDGCPVARNPATDVNGLTTLGLSWLLGGYEYGGSLDQLFRGWIGDVRIAGRALPVSAFMNA